MQSRRLEDAERRQNEGISHFKRVLAIRRLTAEGTHIVGLQSLTLEAGTGDERVRRAVQVGVELDLRHVATIHLWDVAVHGECDLHDGMISHQSSTSTSAYRVVDDVADVVVVVRAKRTDGSRRRVEHHRSSNACSTTVHVSLELDAQRLAGTRDVEAIACVARHDRDFVQVGHGLREDKVPLSHGRLDLAYAYASLITITDCTRYRLGRALHSHEAGAVRVRSRCAHVVQVDHIVVVADVAVLLPGRRRGCDSAEGGDEGCSEGHGTKHDEAVPSLNCAADSAVVALFIHVESGSSTS